MKNLTTKMRIGRVVLTGLLLSAHLVFSSSPDVLTRLTANLYNTHSFVNTSNDPIYLLIRLPQISLR